MAVIQFDGGNHCRQAPWSPDPAFAAKLATFREEAIRYEELPEKAPDAFREAVYEKVVPVRLQLLQSAPGTAAHAAALQRVVLEELRTCGIRLPDGIIDALRNVQALLAQHATPRDAEPNGFHADRFRDYCVALSLFLSVSGDEEIAAAAEGADETFRHLMNAPASSITAVMLKAKAAARECYRICENSMSGRVYGELFNMLAAELETILVVEGGEAARS